MGLLILGGASLLGPAAQAMETTSTMDVTTTTLIGIAPTVLTALPLPPTSTLSIQETGFTAIIGQGLTFPLHVVGGAAPYSWSLIANGLPDGVFFDREAGRLLGAPDRTGRFLFTVNVRDSQGLSVDKQLTLVVGMAGEVLVTPEAMQQEGQTIEPLVINLDEITDQQLQLLVDTFADDAPLIYVGPNAPESILKVNIAQMRIKPHGLYRVEGGTASTVNEAHPYSDVYYVDPAGRRHAFPTEQVFRSWYKEEPKIESVPDWKIANIPLRKNVSFRPGSVVRLENTQEFYRVMPNRTLKKFQDEKTYQSLVPSLQPMADRNMLEQPSVLPLIHFAEYQLDASTINTVSDLPTIGSLPMYPVDEMREVVS